MAYLLTRTPKLLDGSFVAAAEEISHVLVTKPQLLPAFLNDLLLNFRLWRHAEPAT